MKTKSLVESLSPGDTFRCVYTQLPTVRETVNFMVKIVTIEEPDYRNFSKWIVVEKTEKTV